MKKVGETTVPKTEDEFDAEDIKKVENYAKAINMLYCSVNPNDYRKISCCSTAKEMWDKLEVTYEDHQRSTRLENSNKDLVRKILCSLTPEWRSKADAIYESIGVSNVTIDGLIGNLKTYESTILNPSLDEQRKKGITLKATKELVEEASRDDDNEIGHIKSRCPKAKNGKDKPDFKKQRANISWGGNSGDESTNQEEDKASNLYLMEHEDQNDDVHEEKQVQIWAPATTSDERFYYQDGSYLWFDSEEERTRFLTFFSKRVVAPPRILPERLLEILGYDMLDVELHKFRLWPFVSKAQNEINLALIQVFYSNLRREDDVLYSLVKSTLIELTVE
ncbi:unnamed protein product [Cuscuta campestris]|uniref:UBN2 domain-containing protein n=1 Tax=Cuscuta campestris TaxID=132261 RepID=A0A484LDK4_9ASTE|nr:unnamed protein product [Cuscuta campestris]